MATTAAVRRLSVFPRRFSARCRRSAASTYRKDCPRSAYLSCVRTWTAITRPWHVRYSPAFALDIDQAVIDRALDLYDGFDDPAHPVPVVRVRDDLFVAELYHGPTRAFRTWRCNRLA